MSRQTNEVVVKSAFDWYVMWIPLVITVQFWRSPMKRWSLVYCIVTVAVVVLAAGVSGEGGSCNTVTHCPGQQLRCEDHTCQHQCAWACLFLFEFFFKFSTRKNISLAEVFSSCKNLIRTLGEYANHGRIMILQKLLVKIFGNLGPTRRVFESDTTDPRTLPGLQTNHFEQLTQG